MSEQPGADVGSQADKTAKSLTNGAKKAGRAAGKGGGGKKSLLIKLGFGASAVLLFVVIGLIIGIMLIFVGTTANDADAKAAAAKAAAVSCVVPNAPVTGDMGIILATIREKETGTPKGNYTAKGGASGAYQFTDSTWAKFGGKTHAWEAPPNVQDFRAAIDVQQTLNSHGLTYVPIRWYWPKALNLPEDNIEWNRIPVLNGKQTNNTETPKQYQAKWMTIYNRNVAATGTTTTTTAPRTSMPSAGPATTVGAPGATTVSTPAVAPECGSESVAAPDVPAGVGCPKYNGPTISESDIVLVGADERGKGGIEVNKCIQDAFSKMLTNMRNEIKVRVGGGGYRSYAEQVSLRRSHCGSSNYAIYQAPASSCSPPTAVPGKSNHEKGLAIDFDCPSKMGPGEPCFDWLKKYAAIYGFKNLPSEAWHWSVDGR